MKKLLVLLSLLIAVSAHAFTVTIIPKSATSSFGLVIVKNNNYAPGQPTIVFLHGIGECGDGSAGALNKIVNAGYLNVKNDPHSFFSNADRFGYNIVCVQTANPTFYSQGEIKYAYEYAIKVLQADANRVPLVALSLGGFGMARESSKDPSLPALFSSLSIFVMGPGTLSNTAIAYAKCGRPIWFITSADDHSGTGGTNSGTSFQVTDDLYKAVKNLGGSAWETKFKSRGHSSTFTFFNNDAMALTPTWCVSDPALVSKPAVGWYQWLMSVRKGDITGPLQAPVVPIPTPVIVDTVKPLFILYSDSTWRKAS